MDAVADDALLMGAVVRHLDDLSHGNLNDARQRTAALVHLETWARLWPRFGPEPATAHHTWPKFWAALPPLKTWADPKEAWPETLAQDLRPLQARYAALTGMVLDAHHPDDWPWLTVAASRPGPMWQPDATGTDPLWNQLIPNLSPSHAGAWLAYADQREPGVSEQVVLAQFDDRMDDPIPPKPLVYHQHGDPAWRTIWLAHGLNPDRSWGEFASVLFLARDEVEVADLLAHGADPDTLSSAGLPFDRLASHRGATLDQLTSWHTLAQEARVQIGRDIDLPAERHAWDRWAMISTDPHRTDPTPGSALATALAQGMYPTMTLDPGPALGAMTWLACQPGVGLSQDAFSWRWMVFQDELTSGTHVSQPGASGRADWAEALVARWLRGTGPAAPQMPSVDRSKGGFAQGESARLVKEVWHAHLKEGPSQGQPVHERLVAYLSRCDAPWPAPLSEEEAAQDADLACRILATMPERIRRRRFGDEVKALEKLTLTAPATPFWDSVRELMLPAILGELMANPWPASRWVAFLQTPEAALWAALAPVAAPAFASLAQAMRREHALAQQPPTVTHRPRRRS